jgi:hypothetical protein
MLTVSLHRYPDLQNGVSSNLPNKIEWEQIFRHSQLYIDDIQYTAVSDGKFVPIQL